MLCSRGLLWKIILIPFMRYYQENIKYCNFVKHCACFCIADKQNSKLISNAEYDLCMFLDNR